MVNRRFSLVRASWWPLADADVVADGDAGADVGEREGIRIDVSASRSRVPSFIRPRDEVKIGHVEAP